MKIFRIIFTILMALLLFKINTSDIIIPEYRFLTILGVSVFTIVVNLVTWKIDKDKE